MKLNDVAKVLAKISFFDSRPITQPIIAAWHEILAPYDAQLALDAVPAHYAETGKWIMPADVVAYIKAHDPACWDKAAIDQILGGPDYWSPPIDVPDMSVDEYRAWVRDQHAQHLEDRRAMAAKVVTRHGGEA